jgi:Domain of unknown function (DUF4345)
MRAVLLIPCAAYFAWLGVSALAQPRTLLAVFGVTVPTADGAGEIRAVYGGFPVVMAGALIASTFVADLESGAPVAVAAAMGGMILGRAVSLVVDRSMGRVAAIFVVIEFAIVVLLTVAAVLSKQ